MKMEGLYKSYVDINVLKGVKLHINKGNTHGIVGSCRAKKSTLLRCIMVWRSMMLSLIFYIIVIVLLPRLMKLKFYPSYSD